MKDRNSGTTPDSESADVSASGWVRLERLIAGFLLAGAKVQAVIAAIFLIFLALVTFVTVVGRRSPWKGAWLIGGFEISEILMAIITIFGVAYCWYLGGHLRITFLWEQFGPKMRTVFDILASLFFAFWFGIMSWGMWLTTVQYLKTGAKGWSIGIPYGPFMAIFFLATTFFSIILLKDIQDHVMKLISLSKGKQRSS